MYCCGNVALINAAVMTTSTNGLLFATHRTFTPSVPMSMMS